MSALPSRFLSLAVCSLALVGAAGSATAPTPAKEPITCKGPFKTLLEASNANKRGVTLFLNGQTVSGIVAACNADGSIEMTSQQYSRIVVLGERIDGAAM
ncbi:hypothetical protein [Tahibacter sp.]|uniref:hypothetical protein n=1 Tax=Tahibacter sp. TaxID=2056211 RepID=UPI0028C46845|nr:hypothetical protein [Tahibacter sp.]